MSETTRSWTDHLALRLDPEKPYLRIGQATVYVSDQDRSLRFYIDKLGFTLVADIRTATGERWVAVVPPDGAAILELVTPPPDSAEFPLIGKIKRLILITEDVDAVYRQWIDREVPFDAPPRDSEWGGKLARLEDPDGNILTLAGVDSVAKDLERKRKDIAAKLDADRRSSQELEIARDVQMRLFPQNLPKISTLDFAGVCVQSREVGGDYYDFLDLGQDRVGLVIGDVAGKGIAAALLMVSLQANLRSHAGTTLCPAWLDPLQVLKNVNERFYANTNDNAYATLFLAEYDGASRQLQYVNCGHLCGLLLRGDGSVERLEQTATVLGLFPEWNGEIGQRDLKPGDVLVLYTDGVTESTGSDGDEFGESGLIASIQRHPVLTTAEMIDSIRRDLAGFSTDERFDDVTLIVARCR